jgi:hypothetical protein
MSQQLDSNVAAIEIDIGKNSFHIVGQDRRGALVLRQKWSRGQVEARLANLPPCLIGLEACSGAHHLSRKLRALGHDARLMPAKYVRVRAEKQTREKREPLPTTPPVPGSLRWYWTLYRQSDRWLGNPAIGEEGLAESTRDARTGLIEPLLRDNGERPVALARRVLREELKARTPVQAGNLLSALRHMIGWMIDEEHIEPDDNPTIGLKSGKAKVSRESGGWVPWTEEDMAKYSRSLAARHRGAADVRHPALHSPAARRCLSLWT